VRVKIKTAKKSLQNKPIILVTFIALSAATHGLLFLFHTNSQNNLVRTSLGNQKLSVTLSTTERKNHTKSIDKKSTPNPSRKLTLQTAQITTAGQKKTIASATNQKIILQTTSKSAQQNFLLGEIQHRLSQYLSYPIRAQRRGWQGEVLVGFRVDKQGFLHSIHLTQTSGYTLLDNATLSAIGKVRNISPSLWFKNNHGKEFHPAALQLPVKYQLTNS
jgi:TonB family protein